MALSNEKRAAQSSQAPIHHALLTKRNLAVLIAALGVASFVYTKFSFHIPHQSTREDELRCRTPLPQFLAKHHPSADHPVLREAARNFDRDLEDWFNKSDVDSIAIAVVSSGGSVYEGFRGALRANETDETERGTVDRDSIYRLASISKLFTSLETLILRDKGVVNLDDSLSKIFPQFRYTPNDDPITLRQLMSHISGLGRDWPPGSAVNVWPGSLEGTGPGWYNGLPFPSNEEFMDGIARNCLVAPPYTVPSYSNTGYSLLGLANVAANKLAEGNDAPLTHADLLHRDIFEPLNLVDSSFICSDANKANIAIASVSSVEVDLDFGDATNPAGGQMSSLSDLVKLMQTFIDPTRPESLLRPYTIREWMRPMHAFSDDYSEIGALWEIYQYKDSYNRKLRMYQKLGELIGHHTAFTISPTSSFGAVVLTTGPSMQTIPLNELVFSHFQPAFDQINEELTRKLLEGRWVSEDELCEVSIVVDAGSLFVSAYSINGTDVLKTIHPDGVPRKTALWSTGGGEFRLAVSIPNTGCFYQWAALDQYAYDRGFPTNLLRLVDGDAGPTLQVPAIAIDLKRV
ncbi:hypothetical protein M0805_001373 [Coniferiporia weirii]|nr:hypothetical protein M0805_001373 [Coniferiporia weirii]